MAASSEGDSVGLAGVDELFALLALLFLEVGQGGEQEAQFSGGGDSLAVLVGLGLGGGEDVDLVGKAVGGDGAEDVGSVELEVAEVGVDGGAGAAEFLGYSVGGESLAVEVVGFEDASAASGGWVGWTCGGPFLERYICSVYGMRIGDGRGCADVALLMEIAGWAPRRARGIGGGGGCAAWCEIPAASAGMTMLFWDPPR